MQRPWATSLPDQTTLEKRIECIKLMQELKLPDEKAGSVILRALHALKWVDAGADDVKRYRNLAVEFSSEIQKWRNDAFEKAAQIGERYEVNPHCISDIRALVKS